MSKQTIFLGQTANDRTGDPLRTAFDKINDNFDELYAHTLPTASSSVLGGIKIGTGLSIDVNGVVTASSGNVSSLVNGANTVSLDSDGNLTIPGPITNDNGIEMITDRGTVQFGYNLEVPGVASHFHINKVGSFDLFLGDDSDYVKLPSNGGVEIQSGPDRLWTFGTDGGLTLPAGGTITEGVVTSNPTIQLTPATPEVASQKLVIKGGGTVDYHLHLTTGDLTETSIFLGTDDHNVRTNVYGGIEINTPSEGIPSGISLNGSTTSFWDLNPLSNLATTGGSGTGLTVNVTQTEGVAVAIAIVNPGTGYTDNDLITVTSGNANASFFIYAIGNSSWTFGTDGVLTLPEGGTISEGGGFTGAIKLTPAGGANEYQALVIYPTAATDGDHIHLTAGGGTTDLYLGSDLQYVKIEHGGHVVIQAADGENTPQWLFNKNGALTFPDATVQTTAYIPGSALSTVAKTGAINPGVDKVATVSIEPTYDATWVNSYSVSNGGFSCDIAWPSAGNPVFGNIVDTVGNRTVGETLATVLGSALGITGVDGVNDMVIKVATLTDTIATALDLTKSINKLTDGAYTLADGVEGQIMYIVRQNGSTAANIFVGVASARWDGGVYPDQPVIPFQIPFTDMVTIIFTDGAWQASTFGSLT